MDLDTLRTYLLQKPEAYEDLPFGPDVLVLKVMGKIFALVAWEDTPLCISLKCDPEHAIALRTFYDAIQPGYHLNKEHWNTITLNDTIPQDLLYEMIDASYKLVVNSLKKADRQKLANNLQKD